MDEDVVHIHNGMLLSHRKEWNNAICRGVDGPRDDQTEVSQNEKDKHQYDITCMWSLKYDTYELIYKTATHLQTEKRQVPYDITYMWNLKYDTKEPIYEAETDVEK